MNSLSVAFFLRVLPFLACLVTPTDSLDSSSQNNASSSAAYSAFQFFNIPPSNTPTMRAWTCHGRNQREMVDKLRLAGIIKSEPVYTVMQQVDRKNYVPASANAYQDSPLSIGLGQTISGKVAKKSVFHSVLFFITDTNRSCLLRCFVI